MASDIAVRLLRILDQLSGGLHFGFPPVHARGVMFSGTFSPSPDAAGLARAPHASRPSTDVTVRFSASGGIRTVADDAADGSSPQGMATTFYLGDHVRTGIIAHSFNGFPRATAWSCRHSSRWRPRAVRVLRLHRRSLHSSRVTRRTERPPHLFDVIQAVLGDIVGGGGGAGVSPPIAVEPAKHDESGDGQSWEQQAGETSGLRRPALSSRIANSCDNNGLPGIRPLRILSESAICKLGRVAWVSMRN